MKLMKRLPLKGHLTFFFMGISLLTAVIFCYLLVRHFTFGLEDSVKMRLLAEAKAFAEVYQYDSQAPLPKSYVISFYFDQQPKIEVDGRDVLENLMFSDKEFKIIFIDEEMTSDINKEAVVGVYRFRLHDQRIMYGVAIHEDRLLRDTVDIWFDNRIKVILYIALSYILFVLIALGFYSYRVGKKTKRLVSWSEQVSHDYSANPAPDFKFEEYNQVALFLEKALRTNALLIEREKSFLSHASHELRTPIAIILANMEILERIPLPVVSEEPLNRIDRASINMKQIIETMLWLVRKSNTPPLQTDISVMTMLDSIVEELKYLIHGNEVSIITDYQYAPVIRLPETPVRIVIGNLIRNAFQYTHSGSVSITYKSGCIVIENKNRQALDEQFEESFGLGQDLTRKICHKLGWQLELEENKQGVKAKLYLPISLI